MVVNPYEVLGIRRDATPDEARRGYRNRVKKAHPDAGGSEEEFVQLSTALAIVLDPKRREHYDNTGEDQGAQQIDHLEKMALSHIASLVNSLIDELGEQALTVDVIGMMLKQINDHVVKTKNEIGKVKGMIARAEKFKGRFQRDGGNNEIERMIESKIANLQHTIETHVENLKPVERAVEILKNYRFVQDVPVAQQVNIVQTGGAGIWPQSFFSR